LKIAKSRGLTNYSSTSEALPHLSDEKNVRLFEKYGIYKRNELKSRVDILQENYIKIINIEALTLSEMVRRDILPAIIKYTGDLSVSALNKQKLCGANVSLEVESVNTLSKLASEISALTFELEKHIEICKSVSDINEQSLYCHNNLVLPMESIRILIDTAESFTANAYWPYPTYGEILYSI
ncbi:MAG: glutamine synthetase type III, partial [Clostridia bacterium]